MKDGRSLRRRCRSFNKALNVIVEFRHWRDYFHHVDALLKRDPLHRVTFEVDE